MPSQISHRFTAETQAIALVAPQDLNFAAENVTLTRSITSTDLAPIALGVTTVDDDRFMFRTETEWNGDPRSAGGLWFGVRFCNDTYELLCVQQ